MHSLLQDVRFALRRVRRSPGFTLTAVFILALGISANVIVFGVLQAMVLQPLDVPDPDTLVTFAPHASGYPVFSYPEVRDVRDGSASFSAVSAVALQVFGLEADHVTRPVWGYEVSGQYFEAVAIKPYLGRLLQRSDDDHPGASESAVLSWPAWKSHFSADPNIIGKIIRIDKHPYTIVGVTPEGFYGTEKFLQPELFVPMANEESFEGVNWLDDRHNKIIFPIARLKAGVSIDQAQAELNTVAARLQKLDPKENDNLQFHIAHPGLIGDFIRNAARRFLAGIMSLAGIVLLATCANLGGLFAARTADRSREVAIRIAIGSGRRRIFQQVLLEALVVSLLGGACACGLSWVTLTALAAWRPTTDYPIRFLVQPQPSMIVMAFLIAVLAGMLFAAVPLRQIFDTDPMDAIKGGNPSYKGRRWALRDVLLTIQIALCCITVTAAFTSLRGLSKALTTDIGFQPANATLTKFDLSQAAYSAKASERFLELLQQRLSSLPGVQAVGYANSTPLGDSATTTVFSQQTTDLKPSNAAFETFFYTVSPGYFTAAGTAFRAGRDVQPSDTTKTPLVAVVNGQFAKSLFHLDDRHTSSAIGRYFKNRAGGSVMIVGLVADGKYFLTSEEPQEAVFFPMLQQPGTATSLIVRTRPDPSGMAAKQMAATVPRIIRDLDSAIPIRASGTWTSQLSFSFFPARVATIALSLFGAFGLLLSVTGTFGLASYTVSKRMRELSIRVALGAQAKQVVSAALGRMFLLIAAGSAVGLGLGAATGRLLSHIVYHASAQDPFVLAAVTVTLVITGLLSVFGPVRRTLHLDPANLLRDE